MNNGYIEPSHPGVRLTWYDGKKNHEKHFETCHEAYVYALAHGIKVG